MPITRSQTRASAANKKKRKTPTSTCNQETDARLNRATGGLAAMANQNRQLITGVEMLSENARTTTEHINALASSQAGLVASQAATFKQVSTLAASQAENSKLVSTLVASQAGLVTSHKQLTVRVDNYERSTDARLDELTQSVKKLSRCMSTNRNGEDSDFSPMNHNDFARVDSPAKPRFYLHNAVVKGFEKYIGSRNVGTYPHRKISGDMTQHLKNFSSGIEIPDNLKEPISGELKEFKLRTIHVDDVTDENPDEVMFLPRFHTIGPNDDIARLVSQLVKNDHVETSLAFDLVLGIGNDEVEFTIHRTASNVTYDFPDEDDDELEKAQNQRNVHRDNGLDQAQNIDEILGCFDHHGFAVTLDDGDEIELTISTGENFCNFKGPFSPFSQLLTYITKMENVSAVKLTSAAGSYQCKTINFNTEVLTNFMKSVKRVVFENVLFEDSYVWGAAGEEIEFHSCEFADAAFYDSISHSKKPPLKVILSDVSDKCMPKFIRFLDSIIDGIKDGRIIQLSCSGWKFYETRSKSIIDKLRDLSQEFAKKASESSLKFTGGLWPDNKELPGQSHYLLLHDFEFNKPNTLRTKNVRKCIQDGK